MRTLNLGILAHVDAGKTTLSERLLYTAGAIDHVGSVDAGTTQTDSLDLERERGITIRSAVASFLVGDLAVNLVDTPGHPDFIAEVERVLGVLDGAVLVVSAVEGVQPQTPLLFRALQRLHVPTLIFVNKVDRAGADPDARRSPRWRAACRPASCRWARPLMPAVASDVEPFTAAMTHRRLIEALAEHDEAILRAFVGDEAGLSYAAGFDGSSPSRRGGAGVHPVFFGSAARGEGIDALLAGIDELLSRHPRRPGGRRLRPRVQDRAHAGRRARRVRAPVRRHAAATPARAGRRRRGGEADVDQGLRADRRPAAGRPRRPARWRRSAAWARSGSATRSASRRPGEAETARFPRPALEAVVFAAPVRAAGEPARRPRPARRAGPAHRRPPGRPPARDRGLALRRGPEGGHPGDARARLRHRRRLPRDDDRVHRAAGEGRARPRRSSAPRRTRTSPAAARR